MFGLNECSKSKDACISAAYIYAASQTLINLAKNGLFASYKTKKSCLFLYSAKDINDGRLEYSRRPFKLRPATILDLPKLIEIEKACWGNIAVQEDTLHLRLKNNCSFNRNEEDNFTLGDLISFSQSWVAELTNGAIVGVIYTQIIPSKAALNTVQYYNQESLHDAKSGKLLQLLGVSVLSEYANMQISETLRNFVLQLASLYNLNEVIAVTRCSSTSLCNSMKEYLETVRRLADPTLLFHLSAGAQLDEILFNYRPDDSVNFGCAILVTYYLQSLNKSKGLDNLNIEYSTHITSEVLISMINDLCGSQLLVNDTVLSTSFMDLGLDSLRMMELRTRIEDSINFSLYSTILFDFPTPAQLLRYLEKVRNSETPISCVDIGCSIDISESFVPPKHLSKLDGVGKSNKTGIFNRIFITGMSCRFPGNANTPDQFYDLLLRGDETFTAIPPPWSKYTKAKCASLLEADIVESFDPNFFGISQSEAELMDPHQKILLEVIYEALVDAGIYPLTEESPKSIGVFVGLCNNEWNCETLKQENNDISPFYGSAIALSSAANRVSYILSLNGPSIVVDTACSSSLSALHVAINSLNCNDCDIAVVAAADLILSHRAFQVCMYISGKILHFLMS